MIQTWMQNYNPLGNAILSTLLAATPVTLLLYLLAVRKTIAYRAAIYSFVLAIALAVAVFGMPAALAAATVAHSLVYAAIRIAWTLLAAVFVYEITVETGHFEIIKQSIGGITRDRRLQVLLIAFAFGALMEGAGGGGAPVAICGAMMAGLGFDPFQAAVLCLIANTAPVAWGGMGNPIRTLVAVTGLPEADLSAMVGRILPFTAMILPVWLVRTQVKWRETARVWPGLLVCGGGFAAMQFFWSNYMDSTLVDIMGSLATLALLAVFFRLWQPKQIWRYPGEKPGQATLPATEIADGMELPVGGRAACPGFSSAGRYDARVVAHAWSPFVLLTVLVVLWGLPPVKRVLDVASFKTPVPGLHLRVVRTPPVVAATTAEPALFDLALVSNIGNAVFLAGLISGPLLGLSFLATLRVFARTCRRMRFSMLAIVGMIGLGFITRYSGMDAVMGLALTHTGALFPLFGTLIGWLGVALTGTDAGSNALFGSLQVITAQKLGIPPVLMAAANSAGGVMGKMIDAQSIIVACAATGQEGKEGDLFRAVMKHSVLLALIVGLIVMLYAYVLTAWIPSGHRFW
jgi:lactate permease